MKKNYGQREQQFYVEGIPQLYWGHFDESLPTDIPYKPTSVKFLKGEKTLHVDKGTQEERIKYLLRRWVYCKNKKTGEIEKIPRKPLKILISSKPYDDIALEVTARIFLNQRKLPTKDSPKIQMINCARFELEDFVGKKGIPEIQKPKRDYDLVAIYNVFQGSEGERLVKIRDFIEEFNYCPLIVVIGGMEPFEFTTKMAKDFDWVIHFKGELFKNVKQV